MRTTAVYLADKQDWKDQQTTEWPQNNPEIPIKYLLWQAAWTGSVWNGNSIRCTDFNRLLEIHPLPQVAVGRGQLPRLTVQPPLSRTAAVRLSNICVRFLHYGTHLAGGWRKSLRQFSTEARGRAGGIETRGGSSGAWIFCLFRWFLPSTRRARHTVL